MPFLAPSQVGRLQNPLQTVYSHRMRCPGSWDPPATHPEESQSFGGGLWSHPALASFSFLSDARNYSALSVSLCPRFSVFLREEEPAGPRIMLLFQHGSVITLRRGGKKKVISSWGHCVCGVFLFSPHLWVFSGDSGFLPHPNHAYVRRMDLSPLSLTVGVGGPVMEACPVQGGSQVVP